MKERRIYCKTNEERDSVLERLEEMGCRWCAGQKPTQYRHVENAPMTIHVYEDGGIAQGDNGYICDAKTWLKENPKCDLFQIKPNLADFVGTDCVCITLEMIEDAGKIFEANNIRPHCSDGRIIIELNDWNYREAWVNPIKEVKRTAKPGEFVKIVNACKPIKHEYKNGDILKIVDNGTRYGKEKGQFLYKKEYVVLEGYEDCDQVKKFEKFVPHLKSTWSKDSYGIIGEDTPIKDAVGRALKVGDTIELYMDGKCNYGENVIVKDNEMAFVMGCKCSCNKDGSIDGWKIIKKRSYEEIKDGETVDGIKYVKSERHD